MASEKNMGEGSNSKHISMNEDSKFIPRTISDILKDVSECSKNPWELDSPLHSYENELAKMAIDHSEKRTWVSSFQLWTTPVEYEEDHQYISSSMCYEGEQLGSGLSKGKGGAFVASGVTIKDDATAGVDGEEEICGGLIRASPPQQEKKKQRRYWSTELHSAFVHAVNEIGGAEVATPKRILEIMQVKGLTSDEVKSHLQKYRIHIRRLASASSTGPNNSQCLTNMEVLDNDGNHNMQEEVVKSKS